jgi:hypothetical protein
MLSEMCRGEKNLFWNLTELNAIGEGNDRNCGNSYTKRLTNFVNKQNNQKSKPEKEKQF